MWSGFCNSSGSLEAHSTSPGLGFFLLYTVGDTLQQSISNGCLQAHWEGLIMPGLISNVYQGRGNKKLQHVCHLFAIPLLDDLQVLFQL